ncbi:MAG TPA: efflux RND transporter periplasmic adaptor subunit [Saprospiraceae bacterium]|nr:efflux RND transporter periplasmic adaptor subunit [Saprospiraceae bacterium]
MKKIITTIIIIALLAAAGYWGYGYFTGTSQSQITIETVQVKKGNITNEVSATGTIEPVEQVEIGTQVSGEVSNIYVDFNSVVKKGQLIAELDKTNLQAALTDAEASYNAALNELNYYQQNYERQKKMYDAEVVSKADFEQAAFQLSNAEQTVTQRKSNLTKAQTNLSYGNIYSPIDGVVLTKEVEVGQTVAASYSTPTLFTIARDLTKMQVEADVDEADIGGVKEGQRVTFTVDAYPDESFDGVVSQVRLGATVTSNVVTYTVIIAANNPKLKLKPGLTATIIIYTKELTDQTVIEAKALNFKPDEALLQQYNQQIGLTEQPPMPPPTDNQSHALPAAAGTSPKGEDNKRKMVWIKEASGALRQTPVSLGENDGINYQVLSGLQLGDEVVYSMKEEKVESLSPTTEGDSPFMPKPPGRRSK